MLTLLAFATAAAILFAIAFMIAKEEDIIRKMSIEELTIEMYHEVAFGLYPNAYSEELTRRGVVC